MLKVLVAPPTIINGTPDNPDFFGVPFDAIPLLQEAIDRGEYEVISDPDPLPELPNFMGLRDEISYGNRHPLVQNWYDGLPPRQRDPLQIAIARQDVTAMQQCLNNMTIPVDVAAEINELFLLFNIPIVL